MVFHTALVRAIGCTSHAETAGLLHDIGLGNHLAHVYDKIGRRTRAGAAVYGIEAGLLPAEAGGTRR